MSRFLFIRLALLVVMPCRHLLTPLVEYVGIAKKWNGYLAGRANY